MMSNPSLRQFLPHITPTRRCLCLRPLPTSHLQPRPKPTTNFSTTPSLARQRKHPRDTNRSRGVSALRATGTRHRLSVHRYPLPKPVLDPAKRDKMETDEDHGLWGFFNEHKTRISKPEDEAAIGRAWSVPELRTKSWEDLHALWWVCVRERNRIATSRTEMKRLKAFFGEGEVEDRDKTVQETQKAIKMVLTERWIAWESARQEALEDETVDLSGEGPAFQPFVAEEFEREEVEERQRKDPNKPVEL